MTRKPPRLRGVSTIFTLLLLSCLGLAATVPASSGPPPEAQTKAFVENMWSSGRTPGIAVAVAFHGRLLYSEGVGFADLDNLVSATGSTVYNIGSVSKVQTAVAVMQLVEQGKVSLDDPIQHYVPTFPDKGSPITIRHIMTHTSGIRHYRPTDFPESEDNENLQLIASLEEGIKLFKDDPLLFRPGEYYLYSSYAVNLLQGVVEKASGTAFEEYMRRCVWVPAGMLDTSFDIPARIVPHRARGYQIDKGKTLNWPYGDLTYKFASGGMLSTAEDLVRFGSALNHGSLLKAETMALMYKPVEPVLQYQEKGPPKQAAAAWRQALMWRILRDGAGRTLPYHCGTVRGAGACLVNYPDQDLVVAVMFNAYDRHPGYDDAQSIAEFFLASTSGQ